MPQRRARGVSGDKTICLPIDEGVNYTELVADSLKYRAYLDEKINEHPELFPVESESGYRLHGFVESKRQHLRTRRILLLQKHEAYQIRPDFVMPYMSERVAVAEKGLYLRRYGVPFEGIAYVLGGSEKHWYNLCQSLGRPSLVGTTVKAPTGLPPISSEMKSTPNAKGNESILP